MEDEQELEGKTQEDSFEEEVPDLRSSLGNLVNELVMDNS